VEAGLKAQDKKVKTLACGSDQQVEQVAISHCRMPSRVGKRGRTTQDGTPMAAPECIGTKKKRGDGAAESLQKASRRGRGSNQLNCRW